MLFYRALTVCVASLQTSYTPSFRWLPAAQMSKGLHGITLQYLLGLWKTCGFLGSQRWWFKLHRLFACSGMSATRGQRFLCTSLWITQYDRLYFEDSSTVELMEIFCESWNMPLILGVQLFTVARPSELNFIVQDVKWFDWGVFFLTFFFLLLLFEKEKIFVCMCGFVDVLWMYLFTFVVEVLT